MDLKKVELIEKIFNKYKSKLPKEVRDFFEDSFLRLNDKKTSDKEVNGLIEEFTLRTFKFNMLNYVSLIQALQHLAKDKKTHEFNDYKKCKICGIEMRKQYEYKRFSSWHFNDGERIHKVK